MEVMMKGKLQKIAVIQSQELLLTDAQSALDLAATISSETGSQAFVCSKESLSPDFFVLATGLAGEILQKYTTYGFKLAVWGEYLEKSQALHDFMYESNQGQNFFFVATEEQAIAKIEQFLN